MQLLDCSDARLLLLSLRLVLKHIYLLKPLAPFERLAPFFCFL